MRPDRPCRGPMRTNVVVQLARGPLRHCKPPSGWNAVTSIQAFFWSWDGSCIASKSAACPSPQTDHTQNPQKLQVLLQL